MTNPPKPGNAVSRPLWVIAIALVCLVALQIIRKSSEFVDSSALNKEKTPATPASDTTPTLAPVRPKVPPIYQRAKTSAAPAEQPADIPAVNEQPVTAEHPAAPVPIVPIVSSGLAPLTGDSVPKSGGTITGTVLLKGTPPPEMLISDLSANADCGKLHPHPVSTRNYLVSTNGGLANVFVFIRSGLDGKNFTTPTDPVLIDQAGCLYQPYISGAMTHQKITFKNSDPVLHNIHPTPLARGNREINRAQMPGGTPISLSFDVPELPVRVKCDVHPWMFTYVFVVDHPFFAVTDRDGNFTIPNVPPGKYVLEAFHLKTHRNAKTGVQQEVTLTGTATTQTTFTIKAPTN
jgi:hypothetical protein